MPGMDEVTGGEVSSRVATSAGTAVLEPRGEAPTQAGFVAAGRVVPRPVEMTCLTDEPAVSPALAR